LVLSGRLPLALSPQFILAETVSGLAYRFMFEGRWRLLPRRSGRQRRSAVPIDLRQSVRHDALEHLVRQHCLNSIARPPQPRKKKVIQNNTDYTD
jgi:hypothetical protein